jgi:adenosine deaminase
MITAPRNCHEVYKADIHVHWRSLMTHQAMLQAMQNLGIDPAAEAPGFLAQHWKGLPDFHSEYERVYTRLIQNAGQMYDAALAHFAHAASQNCIYNEISVSLRRDEPGKPSSDAMLDAIVSAINVAKRDHNIETRLLANIIRDFGGEEAMRVARKAVYLRDNKFPQIVALGLSGDETCKIPIEDYLPAFKYAIASGLFGTAHAGEVTKENLIETIRVLGPYLRRIGHGITALDDDRLLMKEIADLVLEICLTVNGKLGKYRNLSKHPAPHLWKAGFILALGTDNPGPLQTSIGNEYRLAHEVCGLTLLQLCQLTTAAIKHCFADEPTKRRLLEVARGQKKTLETPASTGPGGPILILP